MFRMTCLYRQVENESIYLRLFVETKEISLRISLDVLLAKQGINIDLTGLNGDLIDTWEICGCEYGYHCFGDQQRK